MLDVALKEQLVEVFSRLDRKVLLRVLPTSHADGAEMLAWAKDIVGTSSHLQLIEVPATELASKVDAPTLEIAGENNPVFARFRGIPGGHEFTSLILTVLYANKKGKLPDEALVQRIRALKGPVRVRTYVSLTCENCPDVVQALNAMASLHADFVHETVDGAVAQEEVQRLGIQGVPAVFVGDSLIHSGKSQLIDLLNLLEKQFGIESGAQKATDLGHYDVAVIGGGPAGVSAAIYSARKGLKTLLLAERLGGQLQETKGIENMISVPYTEGPLLSAQLAKHLAQYPVQILEHRRVVGIEPPKGETAQSRVLLQGGEQLSAQAVIVATGAKWRQLGVPGEKENIGQGVAYCAHCDGPFYRGKKVAVVGGGNSGVEAAIDLAAITTHVTLVEYNDQLKADGVLIHKLLALPNVKVILNGKTTEVLDDGKKVVGLEVQDRLSGEKSRLEVDGVFVQIGLLPNSQFLKDVIELTPYGEIVVDIKGRTSVPGIYAAGDVTTVPFKQIIVAMGDGAKVALSAFEDRMHAAH